VESIVITGGTRGIGLGMTREFLRRGCNVAFCGRSAGSVEAASAGLAAEHGEERVLGVVCDVGEPDQVQSLWDAAASRFGGVDFWINNAGLGAPRRSFWELPEETAEAVVRTNLLGVMNGSRVAMRGSPHPSTNATSSRRPGGRRRRRWPRAVPRASRERKE